MKKISVLGDGAWGTAVANTLATNGFEVTLWCFNKEAAKTIEEKSTNNCYLPGIKLSKNIKPTTELKKALENKIIFQAIPVQFMRSILEDCKEHMNENQLWVSLSKGMENETFLLPTQIIKKILGKKIECTAVSGPSYAVELARQVPTMVTVAAEKKEVGLKIAKLLENDFLKTVLSTDIIGTEMGGATKNVFALGVGILEGAKFGANAKIRFMLDSFEEIKLLIKKLGGKKESFYNPSGVGDFVLTCFDGQSRNHQVGIMLGQGKNLKTILNKTGYIPEGVNTVKSLMALGKRKKFKLPLTTKIYKVIFESEKPEILLHD